MPRSHRLRGFIAIACLLGVIGCGLSAKPISVTVSEIGTCTDYDKTTKEPTAIPVMGKNESCSRDFYIAKDASCGKMHAL